MMPGNVWMFSFDMYGFEAVVNLTEIDEHCVMAKMADEKPPQSVNSILNLVEMRARFNQQRNMEVWLVKLDEDFTEEELWEMAQESPQELANMARMGEAIYSEHKTRQQARIF